MKFIPVTYGSWIALAFAVCAWGLVGFSIWSISNAKTFRLSEETSIGEMTVQAEAALRLHAVARETKEARTVLERLVNVDIVSIVEVVENVGRDAKATLEIGQVFADSPLPSASPDTPPIRPVILAVKAQGTFNKLFHITELLHTLPLPSSVEQIQFEHLPDGADPKKGEWLLSARIRVLTIAPISS